MIRLRSRPAVQYFSIYYWQFQRAQRQQDVWNVCARTACVPASAWSRIGHGHTEEHWHPPRAGAASLHPSSSTLRKEGYAIINSTPCLCTRRNCWQALAHYCHHGWLCCTPSFQLYDSLSLLTIYIYIYN